MSKEKILVVDDEKEIRELLRDVLVGRGYEVITAFNGDEAIEKIHEHDIDLALIDLKMPGLDGMGVLRIIKKEFDPNIGVIMMTAYGDLDTAITAMEMGAYDYLLKPFDNLEAIPIIVRKWLDYRKSIRLRRMKKDTDHP